MDLRGGGWQSGFVCIVSDRPRREEWGGGMRTLERGSGLAGHVSLVCEELS